MLNLAICDDDPLIIELLESYIDKINDIRINYDVFFSPDELYHYKKAQQIDFDVYILDIEMGTQSGLDLAKSLRKDSPYSLIIFLTNYSQYVYDVFEVVTFDFIVKPITFEIFETTIRKAAAYLGMAKLNFVFSYRKNSYSIPCHSITYIEKSGRKAFIHTITGKTYQCNMIIDKIWSQLDRRMFSSIHTSCIVNLSEVSEIVREQLVLKNGTVLYIGRNYRQEIKLKHLQFLKEQI